MALLGNQAGEQVVHFGEMMILLLFIFAAVLF